MNVPLTKATTNSKPNTNIRPQMKPTDRPLTLPLANRFNLKASQIRNQQIRRAGGRGR